MAINFTSHIHDFTTSTRATRTKNFQEYTSKKKLEEAEVLSAEQLDMVKQIRGTFNFALHVDGRYMVITLYHPSCERKYEFIILDLETGRVAECPSVKIAKAEVLEIVSTEPAETTEEATEEEESNDEQPATEEEASAE